MNMSHSVWYTEHFKHFPGFASPEVRGGVSFRKTNRHIISYAKEITWYKWAPCAFYLFWMGGGTKNCFNLFVCHTVVFSRTDHEWFLRSQPYVRKKFWGITSLRRWKKRLYWNRRQSSTNLLCEKITWWKLQIIKKMT